MELTKIPIGAVFLDDIHGLQPEHAYHIDRKRNKDLWHYKSISSHHIAKYKSYSYSCLGASGLLPDKKALNKNKKNLDSARYFGKIGLRQVRCKGTAFKIQRSDNIADLSFIPLPKPTKQDLSENEPGSSSYSCLDEATSLYIHGKGSNYSSNAENTAVVEKDFVLDEMFEKVREFNQRTRDEPENVSLWLEFVAFQDILAQREKAGSGGLSQTATLREIYRPTKSVIEKKLAILENASKSNPSSLEVKLAQLELYQDLWETDKVCGITIFFLIKSSQNLMTVLTKINEICAARSNYLFLSESNYIPLLDLIACVQKVELLNLNSLRKSFKVWKYNAARPT